MAECFLDSPKFFEQLRFSNFTYSHSVVHHWEYLATEKNQEGSVPWSLRSLGQLETHSMRLQYRVIVQCTVYNVHK